MKKLIITLKFASNEFRIFDNNEIHFEYFDGSYTEYQDSTIEEVIEDNGLNNGAFELVMNAYNEAYNNYLTTNEPQVIKSTFLLEEEPDFYYYY